MMNGEEFLVALVSWQYDVDTYYICLRNYWCLQWSINSEWLLICYSITIAENVFFAYIDSFSTFYKVVDIFELYVGVVLVVWLEVVLASFDMNLLPWNIVFQLVEAYLQSWQGFTLGFFR